MYSVKLFVVINKLCYNHGYRYYCLLEIKTLLIIFKSCPVHPDCLTGLVHTNMRFEKKEI